MSSRDKQFWGLLKVTAIRLNENPDFLKQIFRLDQFLYDLKTLCPLDSVSLPMNDVKVMDRNKATGRRESNIL